MLSAPAEVALLSMAPWAESFSDECNLLIDERDELTRDIIAKEQATRSERSVDLQ